MSQSNGTQKDYAVGIRLPHDVGAQLRIISRAEETSVQEQVRLAVVARIEVKRNDPEFQERLQRLMEKERGVLEGLSQG